MDYAIGSEKWPGLAKIMEESGELVQVLAKIISVDGYTDLEHPDGSELSERLIEEIGDLQAALDFFIEINSLSEQAISKRTSYKYQLFWAWHDATLAESKKAD